MQVPRQPGCAPQAQQDSASPSFPDCELCRASAADDDDDEAGAAEAARHLLVAGLLRQYYLARGACPAGVARELFRLLSSSTDQQVTFETGFLLV